MTHQTVADVGEHALIRRIHDRVPRPSTPGTLGIGDDAAVVTPDRGTLSVLTTDALVEGVHFDRAFAPWDAVGHKALAVSLSDLAAMGAAPRYALLSLALPATMLVGDLDQLVDGLATLATRHQTLVVGGNITRSSGPLFIDVTAVGSARRRRILTRTGARAGDDLYVSGDVGAAAAGLACLRNGAGEPPLAPDTLAACRERHLRPEPRVRLGTQLGRNRAARACIDLSDGLADGIRQLCTASGVGATIDAAEVPIAQATREWFQSTHVDPLMASLAGGEDYELLFTAPPRGRRRLAAVTRHARGLAITRIGRITKDDSLVLIRDGREDDLPTGYEHFRT